MGSPTEEPLNSKQIPKRTFSTPGMSWVDITFKQGNQTMSHRGNDATDSHFGQGHCFMLLSCYSFQVTVFPMSTHLPEICLFHKLSFCLSVPNVSDYLSCLCQICDIWIHRKQCSCCVVYLLLLLLRSPNRWGFPPASPVIQMLHDAKLASN